MAAPLAAEPATITHAQAVELATILTINHAASWQAYADTNPRSEYAREERATLQYAGTDPLLQGAALDCWTRRQVGQYGWSARLHAGTPSASKYVLDTLPSATRDTFVSSINISARKPIARIAKELNTRLLAHYLPAYRNAMVRLQEEETQHTADTGLAEELAQLLGTRIHPERYTGRKTPLIYHNKGALTVQHGHVQLERGFSMTAQQARELCTLLASWGKD